MIPFGRLALALIAVPAVALADGKPVGLAADLRAVAATFPPAPRSRPIGPIAGAGCTAPSAAERADARRRALAWIDAQHPDETGPTSAGPDDSTLVVNVGCKDAAGAIVLDVSQDRDLKKKQDGGGFTERRRNYVLRVSATAIDAIAEDTSSSSNAWSEWADEGRIALRGQLDVDGDGALDIVYSDHEHEGGSTHSFDRFHVRFGNGKLGESGQITDLADARLAGTRLAVAGTAREGALFYVCLGADLHLAPCAAAGALQVVADRRAILDRYSQARAGDLPDRGQLAQELAVLGITGPRKNALLAAATPTDPALRLGRKVTAFLVKANLVEPAPMPELVVQAHAEAQTYLDGLATKLGDAACTTTPLTADDKAKATAWIKKQDQKAIEIAIEPAPCGPYTWVAWWPPNDKRRQALLGRDGTRIVGFTSDMQMPGGRGLAQLEHWFTHDGTVVGIAIGAGNLWVIVNGKVVAATKGETLAFYRADDRFLETSSDIFVDGGVLWHGTPTGRERVDPTLVRDHEARRAAIVLLSQGSASSDAKYVAALQLLGVDPALIAEAKQLP